MYLRWEALGERWFGNLCYFDDIRKALTDNPHTILDAHTFGEVFEATLDAFGNWDQVGNQKSSNNTEKGTCCQHVHEHHAPVHNNIMSCTTMLVRAGTPGCT